MPHSICKLIVPLVSLAPHVVVASPPGRHYDVECRNPVPPFDFRLSTFDFPSPWCATGPETDAKVAQANARALARLAAEGKNVTTASADIQQRHGLIIFNDVDNEVLNDNQPFDLAGQTLRFVRTGSCCFDATREPLQFDADVGPLQATWDGVWGQIEIQLPFGFPFGDTVLDTVYATSDIGLFDMPQTEDGYSDQYLEFDPQNVAPRVTPVLRRGVWIWPSIMDLHLKSDANTVTLTWHQRTTRPDSIHGIDQRFQMTLDSNGEITLAYPDSYSWNTFGLVQIVAPGASPASGPFDFSALTDVPTPTEAFLGEAFTLPEFSPHTARDILQARYGTLLDNVDLFAFYQTFYTDLVLYAGGYHSGNVLHMNEINLSWNSRDETANSVLHHEVGHDWLYFGLPSGTGAHPKQGAHVPAAFNVQTPWDSSAMGGAFWLDNRDGTYSTLPYRTFYGYSWHELYLMGLATRQEVTDWWYLSGVPELDNAYYPPLSQTYVADRNDLTADVLDFVDPEYPNSQTHFEVLFTLITRPANPVREEDLANMRRKLDVWPPAWSAATGGRAAVRVHFPELDPNGDSDFDNDVDVRDFGRFQECFSGDNIVTPIGPCRAGDFNSDGDIDLDDYTQWESRFTGECAEPVFVIQPAGAAGCGNHPVTFTVSAENADTLRWRRGGIDLPGETGPTLVFDTVTPENAGTYTALAENACGAVVSASASLVFSDGPRVVLYPNEVSMCPGAEVTFTADIEASGLFTIQWFKDGAEIPGAMFASYTIEAAAPTDEGVYTVEVSDACGTAQGNTIAATLGPPCLSGGPTRPPSGRYPDRVAPVFNR